MITSLINRNHKKIENIISKYNTFEQYLNIQNNDNNQLKITIDKPIVVSSLDESSSLTESYGDYLLIINLNISFLKKSDMQMLLLLNKIMKKKYYK